MRIFKNYNLVSISVFIFIIFNSFVTILSYHSIDDYGGMKNDPSENASKLNSIALYKTFQIANYSITDKIVLIPFKNKYFFFFSQPFKYMKNIIFIIDGGLIISNHVKSTYWPKQKNIGINGTFGTINFQYGENITIKGKGYIDGQGYNFWVYTMEHGFDYRPHMLIVNRTVNLKIKNLYLKNSPQWNLYINDCLNVKIENVEIYVDVEGQRKILMKNNKWDLINGIPTYPLNTDGIDISGKNFIIKNVTVTNFDDGIVVKPLNSDGYYSNCSQNMIISNIRMKYSLGMSIGSVSPHPKIYCIRNITYKDAILEEALKVIYIKPNPPTWDKTPQCGKGIIENIHYKNINVNNVLWVPIWIGPQQMHEPGQNSTGCSFGYPFVGKCIPQPLVTVQDIYLTNITFHQSEMFPGVILADGRNPFRNIVFDNILNKGKNFMRKSYLSKNVTDCYFSGNTFPIPEGFKEKK